MIDTHVHLNDDRLASRFEEIVGHFAEDGIEAVVNIGADLPSSFSAAAQSRDRVFCALGVHPEGAARTTDADYADLEKLIFGTKQCLAVGEIGLDYHYDEPGKDVQKTCFVRQVELADKLRKPLVLHVREAYGDVLSLLSARKDRLHGGIVHCYSGSKESAKLFLDMGYSIAFGGAITFKNNVHAADVIRFVPRDRLLSETDCPYLTPVPFRGKMDNEPKLVRYVVGKMAEILGLTFSEVDRLTTENFYRTFGLKRGINVMSNIVYTFGGGLYVNLTNRCSNRCCFCVRDRADGIGDNKLWLAAEPTANELKDALNDNNFRMYPEVIFCGFGEPTERAETLIEVAAYVKENGVNTRLNTNGLGMLVNGSDFVARLAPVTDAVSVSLNAPDAESYDALCRSRFGARAYEALWAFADACKEAGVQVNMSVVDSIGHEQVEACRLLCRAHGVPLKVRAYIEDAKKENRTRLRT